MAKNLICTAKSSRRFVNARALAQFVGTCISVQLAVPTARFRTRSLYDALSPPFMAMPVAEVRVLADAAG